MTRKTRRRRRAETFEAQAPKKFNYKQIIYDLFYGNEEQQKRQKKFTEEANTIWFPISDILPEDEAKNVNSFLRDRVLWRTNYGQYFGACYFNEKVFAFMSFDGPKEWFITTESRFREFLENHVVGWKIKNMGEKGTMNQMEKRMMQKGFYELMQKSLSQRRLKIKDPHGQWGNMMMVLSKIHRKYTEKELNEKNLPMLKSILLTRGLSRSGTRQNYIDRILENQNNQK